MKGTSCLPRARVWAVVLASWASCGQFVYVAYAGAINESIDVSKLGVQSNFACGGQFACGAVSTINSFIYLEKQFPAIYDNKLTPNYDATTNTDMMDANKFGFTGWQVGTNPMRQGYYARPGGAESDFLQTKKDWINDYAPGTTVFDSWWVGSPDHNRKPTIADLAGEIHDKEDVEFFVQGDNFFHVLQLSGVMCDAQMNCSIKYQDPNDPAQANPNQKMAKIYMAQITDMNGMLTFTGVPGSGYAGMVTITAAFAESPDPRLIPEPDAFVLMLSGAFGLFFSRRRPVR